MKAVNPYLNFDGNTEEAFNFYKSVFGGEFRMLMRFKETSEGAKLSAKDAEKIMHIALPIGDENVLMGTDSMESMGQKLVQGNNFYISIHSESVEEGNKIFKALEDGGKVGTPFQKQFWGDWHGNLTDKFGIQWMLNYTESQQ